MTRARLLLARGTQADLYLASQVLDALSEIASQSHNTHFRIEILAMQAVTLWAQGRGSDAEAALLAALDLSARSGYVRAYVDLGPPMQSLLSRLATRDAGPAAGDRLVRILAAFPAGQPAAVQPALGGGPASAAPAARHSAAAPEVLIEPLTTRELQILTLMQEPLTAKEIAHQLCISPSTAKRHIANLYDKLGVNRRREALARARELRILTAR